MPSMDWPFNISSKFPPGKVLLNLGHFLKTMHFWSLVGEAKMCLGTEHFVYIQVFLNQELEKCSDGSNAISSNIERTRTSIFEHRTDSNINFWTSNRYIRILAIEAIFPYPNPKKTQSLKIAKTRTQKTNKKKHKLENWNSIKSNSEQ